MRHRLSILFVTFLFSSFLACTKTSTSESKKNNETSSIPEIQAGTKFRFCPPGQHLVLAVEFTEFNFHRKKRDCRKGFGICLINSTGWHFECRPNTLTAYIKGTTGLIWAVELENQVEIHFPLDLKNDPDYSSEDLEVFGVDEEYTLCEDVTLKPGDYAVKESDTELIVVVDRL